MWEKQLPVTSAIPEQNEKLQEVKSSSVGHSPTGLATRSGREQEHSGTLKQSIAAFKANQRSACYQLKRSMWKTKHRSEVALSFRLRHDRVCPMEVGPQ